MQIEFRKASAFFTLAFVLLCGLALLTGVGLAEGPAEGAADDACVVQFYNWDNTVLHVEQVKKGEPVGIPDVEPPKREYHVFAYWFDVRKSRDIPYDFAQPVEGPMTLKAFYSIKPDLKSGERAVVIYRDFGPVITNGELVNVVGELIGFEGCNVFLQWQYRDENNKWVNIDGANSLLYQFEASQQTINREYRLGVTVLN